MGSLDTTGAKHDRSCASIATATKSGQKAAEISSSLMFLFSRKINGSRDMNNTKSTNSIIECSRAAGMRMHRWPKIRVQKTKENGGCPRLAITSKYLKIQKIQKILESHWSSK